MSSISDREGDRADRILDALLKSPKAGGVPTAFLESLTEMVRQMGAAHDTAMRDIRAEYDAKLDRLMRAVDGMAKGQGYDPPDGFGENGGR